jgi:hypothetical protein
MDQAKKPIHVEPDIGDSYQGKNQGYGCEPS